MRMLAIALFSLLAACASIGTDAPREQDRGETPCQLALERTGLIGFPVLNSACLPRDETEGNGK